MSKGKASQDDPRDRFKSADDVLKYLHDNRSRVTPTTSKSVVSLMDNFDKKLQSITDHGLLLQQIVDMHVAPVHVLAAHAHETFKISLFYVESTDMSDKLAKKVKELDIGPPGGKNDSEIAILKKMVLTVETFWSTFFYAVKHSTEIRGYGAMDLQLQQSDAGRMIGVLIEIQREMFVVYEQLETNRAQSYKDFGEFINEEAAKLDSVKGIVTQLTRAFTGLYDEIKSGDVPVQVDQQLSDIPLNDPLKMSLTEFKDSAFVYMLSASNKVMEWQHMMTAMTNFATCIQFVDIIDGSLKDFEVCRENSETDDIEEYCLETVQNITVLLKEIPQLKKTIKWNTKAEEVLKISSVMREQLSALNDSMLKVSEWVHMKHSPTHYDEVIENISEYPEVLEQFGGPSLDPKGPKSLLSAECDIRVEAQMETIQGTVELMDKGQIPVSPDMLASRRKLSQLRAGMLQDMPDVHAPLPITGKKRSRDNEATDSNFRLVRQATLVLGTLGAFAWAWL